MKMEHWYTFYTKPSAEYQVVAALQEHKIQQVYLPEISLVKAAKGRKKKPFFPCYLFVKANLGIIGPSFIQWTPGLRHIVTVDNQPIPVADEIIELIRRKLDTINKTTGGQPAHPFKPGDTVRIIDGPLQDMLAIFEGPTTPSERVNVLLNFLGYARKVNVAPTDLEKAPGGAEVPTVKRPRRTRGRGRQIKENPGEFM